MRRIFPEMSEEYVEVGKNMEEHIFISVMICCYNSEKYLYETLDSVVNQTYKNWEIVAINDGSSDKTEEIILQYKTNGVPITYIRQKNLGFAAARNKAIEMSKGEWIAIIDHDDICLPRRLEIQAKHIRENPNAKLFFSNTIHFDDHGVAIRRQFDKFNPCQLKHNKGKAMNNLLAYNCFIDTESVIFSKQAALSIGGFDTSLKYVVDYDFFIKMGSKFDLFGSEEITSMWRVHHNQASQIMGSITFRESNKIFFRYFFFEGISNRTRFSMIYNLVKKYVKRFLISINIL